MKATELRIGNYLYDAIGNLCKVKEIKADENEIYAPVIKGVLTQLPNKPIPITEEWLLKFGFECDYKSPMHSVYYLNGISYYFWYDDKRQYLDIKGLKTKIDFIHQLQNLIFALTNEELTLTEQ